MRIRQYIPGDEDRVELIEPVSAECMELAKKHYLVPDWTWTRVTDDGEIMGLGGIVPCEDNAYVWLMINRKSIEAKPKIVRGFEELEFLQDVVRFAESFRFSYLWTAIFDGFCSGEKLARFLGFKRTERRGRTWIYRKEGAA
jgi:hypothetical protein